MTGGLFIKPGQISTAFIVHVSKNQSSVEIVPMLVAKYQIPNTLCPQGIIS